MTPIEIIKKRVEYYLKKLGVLAFCKPGRILGEKPFLKCEILLRTGPWKRIVTVLDIQETGWVIRNPVREKLLTELKDSIESELKYFVIKGWISDEKDIYFVFWVIDETCPSEPALLRKGLSTFLSEGLFKKMPIEEIMKRFFRALISYPIPFQERMVLPRLLSAYAISNDVPVRSLTELVIDKMADLYKQILDYLYHGLETDLPDDLKRWKMTESPLEIDASFLLPIPHKLTGISIFEIVIILSLFWSVHIE